MSEEAAERIAVIWSPESRAGDVKKLKPPRTNLRLRCGYYRVFFDLRDDNTIGISGVRNRRGLPLASQIERRFRQ